MNDTHPDVQKIYEQMMYKKSGAERMRMGASMFDSAREISRAFILSNNPGISPNEFKMELFKLWYGDDFDTDSKDKIMRIIGDRASI